MNKNAAPYKRLNSCLYRPGTKFIITGEIKNKGKGALSPGSCGFISHIKGSSKKYPYMALLDVVVTRIGKKGKQRIQSASINVPIFSVKGIEIPMGEMPGCVCITRAPLEHRSLLKINSLDFLAWGLAQIRYLNKLASRAPNYMWPETKNVPINVLYELEGRFGNDPKHTLEVLGDEIFRRQAIADIREMEASLIKCYLEYNERASMFESKGINCIDDFNNAKSGELLSQDIVGSTVVFYGEKAARMKGLLKGATKIDPGDILSNIFPE